LVLIAVVLAASVGTRPAEAQTLAAILADQAPSPGSEAPGPQAPAGDALFGTLEFTSSSLRALPQWRRILDTMAQESSAMAAKLHTVNQFFNRWPYKSDAEAFGQREYWASPSDFMSRSGDCEDYAIAKYFALRQLGFDKQELRIVVLYDRIRNVGHAVLAVYDDSDILILDSLSNLITAHTRYRHYIPQYSMNETTRWAHVDRHRAIPQTALRALDN
jgi:predicted transglutaminase-like cysteine proteinase